MARTARWMARVVAGFVMAGVVLVVPITVASGGPAARAAVVTGAGTLTTDASATADGGSVYLGRRWS
jgi:hypothetical protein